MKFNPFKDFKSDQIQRSSRKIFTAKYACRNADLNLTLVTGTTNGFIFQIINSLIESYGVRLTCFDCNFEVIVFIKRHTLSLLYWSLLAYLLACEFLQYTTGTSVDNCCGSWVEVVGRGRRSWVWVVGVGKCRG